jgi:hypothetical protein
MTSKLNVIAREPVLVAVVVGGHPYDYITSKGYRRCRSCKRENDRNWIARKRGGI